MGFSDYPLEAIAVGFIGIVVRAIGRARVGRPE